MAKNHLNFGGNAMLFLKVICLWNQYTKSSDSFLNFSFLIFMVDIGF